MQTKLKSLIESIINTLIGFIISFLIQIIIYPVMDIPVSFNQNILITIIFTFVSIARNYFIRRFFTQK